MRSIAIGLMLGLLLTSVAVARAGLDTQSDWVEMALTTPAQRLWTPSSGALLASTSNGLMRSDDAGDSWYPLVPGQNVIYVDPSSQDTLYATAQSDVLRRT